MQLQVQAFATMVKTQTSAAITSCSQVIDVSVGSVFRALFEANASVGLWIQWLVLEVLSTTRAATSSGKDLDSWVADFGLARLAASPAAGQVTFSRLTAGLATVIPLGTLVRTGFGADDLLFEVAGDAARPAWTGQGYALAATDLSITVPVVAQQPGSAGNVRAGLVAQLATAIPGVDSVTNDSPMLGGLDAESDAALRARFSGFLDSRTRATAQAVGFAISSVQQGLSFTIADRVDASGAERAGHFTVTVDDGTGAPSAALIFRIATAVEQVRPIGGTFSIRPPLVIPVNVSLQVNGAAAAVRSAIFAFVSALPIGAPLILSRLYQVAHDADPGVINVTGVLINGRAEDVVPPLFGLLRPSSVQVAG